MSQVADRGLNRLGGVAALVVVVLTLGEVVGHVLHPLPDTIEDWYRLFQTSPMIGHLDFWGLEVLMYAMFALVFLALYAALRDTGRTQVTIATALAFLGIGVFLATNNPFTMMSLSRQYASATTDVERSTLLAAGRAVLAITGQRAVAGFNLGLFLVSVAGLIVSAVMLRSSTFGGATAYVGMAAHVLSLADYVRQAATTSPVLALLVILPGALALMVWYAMVGRRLIQMGRAEGKTGQP